MQKDGCQKGTAHYGLTEVAKSVNKVIQTMFDYWLARLTIGQRYGLLCLLCNAVEYLNKRVILAAMPCLTRGQIKMGPICWTVE